MIEGTVVVYGKCKFAPEGHVCFFIKDNGDGTYQSLQQNANGRMYVTIDNNPYDGIIGAFIPNQIQEEFNRKLEEQKKNQQPTGKTIDELAQEVINGAWGNGEDRKNRLTQAGYDYSTIQNRVNEILNKTVNNPQLKPIDEIAKEVIRGAWGNGQERKDRLTNAGYNYNEVQNRVNELFK